DAREELLEIREARDRHADLPNLARDLLVVRVVAHLRREIERDGEARLPMLEEVTEARVRFLGGAEPRVLPHRPEAAAVHRRPHAARVRRLAGETESLHRAAVRIVVRVR